MAAVTCENSLVSTNHDMGENHIEAHDFQHNYLQDGEPLVETLTNNALSDDSIKLAIKKAQEQGLRNEEEWRKYNAKIRKNRRKNNYMEYVAAVGANIVKHKEKQLNSRNLSRSKRDKIAQEIAAIHNNGGVPIDGSLFYISNTLAYDNMKPAELKKYREFEAETFRRFCKSETFRTLNPGLFRAEIHYDEAGAIHLQVQSVWYHVDKLNRATYSKRGTINDLLVQRFGSKKALDRRLDLLCYLHHIAPSHEVGDMTPLSGYNQLFDLADTSGKSDTEWHDDVKQLIQQNKPGDKYYPGPTEKNIRLMELWRIEQMNALGDIAKQVAKEKGVKWTRTDRYVTDGHHRTGPEYRRHREELAGKSAELHHLAKQVKQKHTRLKKVASELKETHKQFHNVKKQTDSLNNELSTVKTTLTEENKHLAEVQQHLAQVRRQVQKEEQRRRQRKREMDKREKALQQLSQQLDEQGQDLKQQLQQLQQREDAVTNRENAVQARENNVERRESLMQKLVQQFVKFAESLFPEQFEQLRATIQREVEATAEKRQAEAQKLQEQERQQQQEIMDKALTTQNLHEFLSIEDNRAQFEHESPDYSKAANKLHEAVQEDVLNGKSPVENAKRKQDNNKKRDDGDDLEF